jgi:hypothetical protein
MVGQEMMHLLKTQEEAAALEMLGVRIYNGNWCWRRRINFCN